MDVMLTSPASAYYNPTKTTRFGHYHQLLRCSGRYTAAAAAVRRLHHLQTVAIAAAAAAAAEAAVWITCGSELQCAEPPMQQQCRKM